MLDDRIRFVHFRLYDPFTGVIMGKGGMTYAYRQNPHGDGVQYAFSSCSIKDNYCKETGRELASMRLALEIEGKVFTKDTDTTQTFASNVSEFIERRAFEEGAFVCRKFSRKSRTSGRSTDIDTVGL